MKNLEYDPTKLSISAITVITMNMITTSLLALFSQPFIPEMIRFFGYSEYEKGYYAGLVQTAFYGGRIFGSVIIGRLADKMSKYRVLMVCLTMSGLFTLIFGLTIDLYFTICMKLLIGLVSGTALLSKAIVYDLCTNENQSIGMLFHMIGVYVGTILGSMVGGYLQNPAKLYPNVFKTSFFMRYPYFLCSLVVTGFIGINVTSVYVFEKSLKRKIRLTTSIEMKEPAKSSAKESTLRAFARIMRSKKVIISLGIYLLFSLCSIGVDELLILYLSTEVQSGGLGFSAKAIGNFITYCSIPGIFLTIFVFTQLMSRFGIIWVIKYVNMLALPLIASIPLSYIILTKISSYGSTVFMYVEYILIKSNNIMMFGPIGLILNNAADVKDVGTVNGIGLSLSCLFRSIAPVMFESIYAASLKCDLSIGKVFGSLISFEFIAFFYLCLIILSFFVPKSLEARKGAPKTSVV